MNCDIIHVRDNRRCPYCEVNKLRIEIERLEQENEAFHAFKFHALSVMTERQIYKVIEKVKK